MRGRKFKRPAIVVLSEVRMRLKDKIAIIVGAGQSPGEGLGNGRATVLRFAQEGAKVLDGAATHKKNSM